MVGFILLHRQEWKLINSHRMISVRVDTDKETNEGLSCGKDFGWRDLQMRQVVNSKSRRNFGTFDSAISRANGNLSTTGSRREIVSVVGPRSPTAAATTAAGSAAAIPGDWCIGSASGKPMTLAEMGIQGAKAEDKECVIVLKHFVVGEDEMKQPVPGFVRHTSHIFAIIVDRHYLYMPSGSWFCVRNA